MCIFKCWEDFEFLIWHWVKDQTYLYITVIIPSPKRKENTDLYSGAFHILSKSLETKSFRKQAKHSRNKLSLMRPRRLFTRLPPDIMYHISSTKHRAPIVSDFLLRRKRKWVMSQEVWGRVMVTGCISLWQAAALITVCAKYRLDFKEQSVWTAYECGEMI